MAKTSKLSSSAILQGYSKEFVQKKLTITIGNKDYDVLVDQKFRVTKLQEMIMEGLENYNNTKELDESVKTTYFLFLIIKHFTDIDVAKAEKFDEQIKVLKAMLDLEIFDKIVNAFPESEMKRIKDYMVKFTERVNELVNDKKSLEDLKDIVGNELKEMDVDAEDEVKDKLESEG
jgi:hypothetical protein